MKNMVFMIDANIILDVLQNREELKAAREEFERLEEALVYLDYTEKNFSIYEEYLE